MAGKETTEAFEDVGHSTDARELMKKYKIGELVESERKKIPEKAQPDWNTDKKEDEKYTYTIESLLKFWLYQTFFFLALLRHGSFQFFWEFLQQYCTVFISRSSCYLHFKNMYFLTIL